MTEQPATPRGFPPLLGESPHTLVLGSFPSVASLAAQQYYAHPRNAFWPIMGMLLGFDATLPYPERTRALTACGIALWDVIASCHRPGSRDDAIVGPSVEPNDIVGLLIATPTITRIVTNGTTAERLFRRHVWRALPLALRSRLQVCPAPSTSPAHATRTVAEKTALWRVALGLSGAHAV
ncbi:MAG: DNA-deoxyinosine glycosylase [Hydrogenophilus thermoluteolus]